MGVCFNFECKFRANRALYTTCFRTGDSTEWRLTEKWRQSADDKVGMQQRLTFRKLTDYDKHYDIQVDIFSIEHNARGVIRRFRRAKPSKTSITTSLLNLQELRYCTSLKREVAGVEINIGVLTDIFRCKVTIRRAHELLLFPRLDNWRIFSDQMRSLAESKIFADDMLECEGQYIGIHKCILTCRSSLFATLYESERLQEQPPEPTVVKGVKTKILRKALDFIYGGLFGPVDASQAVMLFDVAWMFEMEYFKDICRDAIEDVLDPSRAVEVLYIADLWKDAHLKEICKSVIAKNFETAVSDSTWEVLKEKLPLDAEDISTFCGVLRSLQTAELHGSPNLPPPGLYGLPKLSPPGLYGLPKLSPPDFQRSSNQSPGLYDLPKLSPPDFRRSSNQSPGLYVLHNFSSPGLYGSHNFQSPERHGSPDFPLLKRFY